MEPALYTEINWTAITFLIVVIIWTSACMKSNQTENDMNHYKTSTGKYISKQQIDRRVRAAKAEKLKQQFEQLGYHVCTVCYRNDCKPIDCAHLESVDSCQKNGHCEKAWDLNNIQIMGRICHRQYDKNNIQSANIKENA